MNLKELNRDRQLSELTGQSLCETNQIIDKFFNELFNGMSIREIGDAIYFSKNENSESIYMRQNNKYETLYVSPDKIWRVLYNDIGLNYTDTQILIQSRIKEYFNIEVSIPWG